MSINAIVGFSILFTILGLLWVANSVVEEMLEEQKNENNEKEN